MKVVSFIEGRPKPQPRITQRTKFLFTHTVEYWEKVDADNLKKSELCMLNRKGNPVKPTRYAYRLQRLTAINDYRAKVYSEVNKATNGDIPYQNLFFFFFFHSPKSWSKKKYKQWVWKLHEMKPDYTNLIKGVEDALYEDDGKCNAVANYKMYVPHEYPEGLLIMHDEEIHRFVIDAAISEFSSLFSS